MAGFVRGSGLAELYRAEGVADINPRNARGNFAKALRAENAAGETTQEALDFLDLAIAQIDANNDVPKV